MAGPRILVLDIETAPLNVWAWGLWEQNTGVEQIGNEWTVLSYSAQWLDDSKVLYRDTGGRGRGRVRDDRALLCDLWKLLDEADIVVTQNGVSFDIRKINARLVECGFKPYSPVKVIDTKLVAQKYFGFTSNSLAWLGKHLTDTPKSEHKKFPGFNLWAECLKDNPEAWREMERYNKQDVTSTRKVYLRLRPWIEGHPTVTIYSKTEVPACPKCGSQKVQRRGFAHTQVSTYLRYRCSDCGGWSRGRVGTRDAGTLVN